MMKAQIAFLISVFSLTHLGCSNIPEEAITLNQEILKEVEVIHKANKSLTNLFFDSEIEKIERMEYSSINRFITLVSSELETDPSKRFGHRELTSFYDGIKAIHDSSKIKIGEIKNQRELATESLDNHFNLVSEACTTITKILASKIEGKYSNLNILKNLLPPPSPVNIAQEK